MALKAYVRCSTSAAKWLISAFVFKHPTILRVIWTQFKMQNKAQAEYSQVPVTSSLFRKYKTVAMQI